MQLTKHTDFALRCLMYVGTLPDGELVTISGVSEKLFIPRNHLMKIVNQLSNLGYVESVRGSKGGIRLGLEAKKINLAKVINDFEVRTDPVNCDNPICPLKRGCELRTVLFQAKAAFFEVLEAYSLADLLQNNSPLEILLSNKD